MGYQLPIRFEHWRTWSCVAGTLFLLAGGCVGHDQLRLRDPSPCHVQCEFNCVAQLDPECHGYHPTCWIPWAGDCPGCPPPPSRRESDDHGRSAGAGADSSAAAAVEATGAKTSRAAKPNRLPTEPTPAPQGPAAPPETTPAPTETAPPAEGMPAPGESMPPPGTNQRHRNRRRPLCRNCRR